MKGTDGGHKLSELLSGRGGSAGAVVNVAAIIFKFGAVVLTKNWCSIKPTKRLAKLGPIVVSMPATPLVCLY